MRAISENLLKKIQSNTRAYDIMLTVYHRYIDADGNISFDTSTDYSSNAELLGVSGLQGATTGYLQLGKTFVSEIDFSLTKNAVCRVGDKVRLWLDFGESNTITLATAYVDTVSHDQWQSNFTAYDKMMQLNKAYISKLTYPASASAVVDEICEQTGLELEPFVFECNPTLKVAPVSPNTDYNGNSVYYSYREILGYIALANASNVVIDEETERLKFVKYTDSGSAFDYNKTIRRTINNENYVINAIKVSDTGYSEGNAKGEFEVFFPLQITQPKEYIYSYLTTFFVGLSYIGMTAQKQGYGIYQIGDLVNYADFDGQNYTFAVMGVKYDFSGGYFTEQLYSLAPSEMEAEYSGGIYVGQSNTNIKNPVIISEKSKNYLKYDYTSVGYIKGDEASYGNEENTIINNGYLLLRSSQAIDGDFVYKRMDFPVGYNLYTNAPVSTKRSKVTNLAIYCHLAEVDYAGGRDIDVYVNFVDEDGVLVGYRFADFYVWSGADWGIIAKWGTLYSPTQEKPYGYADIIFEAVSLEEGKWQREYTTFNCDVEIPFANINEYNMAVQLTSAPLVTYDVTQSVLQVVEGDKYADLPEIGTADTLYVTYQPPAVYKYSTVTQSYYCVGRNYKEIQRIVSTTKPDDNEVATYKVPIVFDVRTKSEWELESNTVFPKGFVILEQEPETREKTKIKIANGIDKLSDLSYNGIDESMIDGKADKEEFEALSEDYNATKTDFDTRIRKLATASANHGRILNEHADELLLKADKTEVTALQGEVTELQKSRRNYIYNSAFLYGSDGWVLDTNCAVDKTRLYNCHPTVKLNQTGLSAAAYNGVSSTALPIKDKSEMKSGELWNFSCKYYAEDISTIDQPILFQIQGIAEGATALSVIAQRSVAADGITAGKWQEMSFSFTPAQNYSACMVNCFLIQNGVLWFADFKLEKNNKSTEWIPAYEDAGIMAERIATLEAALLSLGGEV